MNTRQQNEAEKARKRRVWAEMNESESIDKEAKRLTSQQWRDNKRKEEQIKSERMANMEIEMAKMRRQLAAQK